jgi:hypothetical protein
MERRRLWVVSSAEQRRAQFGGLRGAVLSGQCSAAHGIEFGAEVGLDALHRGLGPKVTEAAARFGEQHGSVVGASTEGHRSCCRVW